MDIEKEIGLREQQLVKTTILLKFLQDVESLPGFEVFRKRVTDEINRQNNILRKTKEPMKLYEAQAKFELIDEYSHLKEKMKIHESFLREQIKSLHDKRSGYAKTR